MTGAFSDWAAACWGMQALFMKEEEALRLSRSAVALIGVGGIGGVTWEGLLRNGFENLWLADMDCYELSNTRQLYMKPETVGVEKTAVAVAHAHSLNPSISIHVARGGLGPANAREFLGAVEIILHEADTLLSYLLSHYWGAQFGIPVIQASRRSWDSSHELAVRIADYRHGNREFDQSEMVSVCKRWGVSGPLAEDAIRAVMEEAVVPGLEEEIACANAAYRRNRICGYMENDATAADKVSGGRGVQHMSDAAERFADNFHRRRVSPEHVLIMGGLAVRACKRVALSSRDVDLSGELIVDVSDSRFEPML